MVTLSHFSKVFFNYPSLYDERSLLMGVLIGGSGSSGTTLLRTMIDRHPTLFSGPEISIFNKEMLYTDWKHYKKKLALMDRRLSTDGWCPYPSTNLLHEDYGWQREDLVDLILCSTSFKNFYEEYFGVQKQRKGFSEWVEKTPSNTYGFGHFLRLYRYNKVIHVLRNPYDVMTSLINRGMSPYFAAGLWVYNNSAALSVSKDCLERLCTVKYEDLAGKPTDEITRILTFLGVSLNATEYLISARENVDIRKIGIASWRSRPYDQINSNSVGSFKRNSEERKADIISALEVFNIKESWAKHKGLCAVNAKEVCDIVGYSYIPSQRKICMRRKKEQIIDWAWRSVRRYSTGGLNYPAKIQCNNKNV